MPSCSKRRVPRAAPLLEWPPAVRICTAALTLTGLLFGPVQQARADGDTAKLVVNTDPDGGVRAAAVLEIPASRAAVQAVLTDYAHWPELFTTTMRVAHLDRQQDRVITDLYLNHMLLPGERRLLCVSRELPGGGLETTLLGGDFRRYHRTWRLSETNGGAGTRAEFDLLVEVETFAPDWLVALGMRRELEAHFRLLRERALARVVAH